MTSFPPQNHPRGIFEGEYTNWTLKWVAPYTFTGDWGSTFMHESFISADERYAFLQTSRGPAGDVQPLIILDMDTGIMVTHVPTTFVLAVEKQIDHSWSRYAATVENLYELHIIKDGEVIQTITPEDVTDSFWTVCMSISGKFIVVSYAYTDLDESEIWCYEGQP